MVNYLLLRRITGEVKQSYEDYHAALEKDFEEMLRQEREISIEAIEQKSEFKTMMEFYSGYLESKEWQ